MRYEGLEARGVAAPAELDSVRREEASALALVAAAEAGLRRAEMDHSQAVLTAPFGAVVVEKLVSPGDLASPGRPLVRISSRAGQRVEAAPGEADAARIRPGDRVEVLLGESRVEGLVAEVSGGVDPVTRRRSIRVDLPAGLEPPVGAFARIRLPGTTESQVTVPRAAVVQRGGLEIVWIVDFDARVSPRYVRTGPELAGGSVQIRSGLKAGERVVVDPPADLAAGARISS
jgi:RND family efflux transporter MFP subunit